MHTIFDVADWFLNKEPMTHKKLQKLCYYALAWSYAIQPEPICDAEFEAWVHGPVCRSLYSRYSDYHFSMIPKVENYTSQFSTEENDFLESVWMTYGNQCAHSLEALSHSEKPWKIARAGLAPDERGQVIITPESMKDYYRSIYDGEDA